MTTDELAMCLGVGVFLGALLTVGLLLIFRRRREWGLLIRREWR